MFNGVPDQFHQFGPSLPFPLSFPLHHHLHHGLIMSPSNSTPSPLHSFPSSAGIFDLYNSPPSAAVSNSTTPQHNMLQLQQQSSISLAKKDEELVADDALPVVVVAAANNNSNNDVVVLDGDVDERSMLYHRHHHDESASSTFDDLWSNDEVVALFKIRSALQDNWFPDFTWDLVSRKLAELGYQRSGEKCKEKFEEESSRAQAQFNNNVDMNYNKNYRFLSELNELYDHHHHHHVEIPAVDTAAQIIPDHQQNPLLCQDQQKIDEEDEKTTNGTDDEDSPANKPCEEFLVEEKSVMKKRKRKKSDDDDEKFEMLIGFSGNVVKKVIEKQEEMHRKVIEHILKREEESVAREEAWRNQQIRKIDKEIELRGQEKANASENEAKMIELLRNFIVPPTLFDSHSLEDQIFFKKTQALFMSSPPAPQNPENSIHGIIVPYSTSSSLRNMEAAKEVDGSGKRWPRDEVLALINIRCKLNNNNNNNNNNNDNNKGPLWERISKGMMEMGYKRSAKRCKEKWENINKYFRKTKDINKKRSQDSRTCPYFQQLSCLYSHQLQQQEIHQVDPGNNSDAPES